MFRTTFPPLDKLKARIATLSASGDGWPTCILNVRAGDACREAIAGPLSVFMNLGGTSVCRADGHHVRVDEDHYFLSNRGQEYDLLIDGDDKAETFNIHIEEKLTEQVLAAHFRREDLLLDTPDAGAGTPVNFFSQLYRRDDALNALVREVRATQAGGRYDPLLESEQMCRLTAHLIGVRKDVVRRMEGLSALRRVTKAELFRRLSMARDYMHSYYDRPLQLDELARTACMSRYHFLRRFSEAFGSTPHQYLKGLRLDNARRLLARTGLPVSDIAVRLGYQNLSSFSRVFRQSFGRSPQEYRAQARPEKIAISVKS